jgi:hypothetical protein
MTEQEVIEKYKRDFASRGGKASAKSLTPEQRANRARKASRKGWDNYYEKHPKTQTKAS